MNDKYSGILAEKYDIEESDDGFCDVAGNCKEQTLPCKREMSMTQKRQQKLMLDDFRNGRLGRITLEFPDEMDA